jgi:hypothetical protein
MNRYIPQNPKTINSVSNQAIFQGKNLKLPTDSKELSRQKFKVILKEKLSK